MWLQRFTNFLLSCRWRALLLTFFVGFVPVLNLLSILIAAFITLSRGALEGAIFTVAATVPYFFSFLMPHDAHLPALGVFAAAGVAVLSNILTYVFAVMLQRQTSWRDLLQIAALMGVLVISLVHLAYPHVTVWWGQALQNYYTEAQGTVSGALKPAVDAQQQLETINNAKWYATGLMTTTILVNALVQLLVARWWQAIMYRPKLLRRELRGIRLSPLAGVLFLISLAFFFYWGNSVIIDIMPVLYALFCAAGLSLIHYLFGFMQSPTAWFWLLLLYVILILALPVSAVLVAMLALFDIWFDVRKRVSGFDL